MNINLERVITDIKNLSTFTSTPNLGVTRLSFTKEDREAREYIKSEMNKIGLKVYEDGYSNLFGRLEGTIKNAPVIMMGSHFDSVKNGGPLDGVLGVVSALEIIRTLKENNINPKYPLEIAAFNDEEGVRFGNGISNSRAMAGLMTEKELDTVRDIDNITLRQAMEDFGIDINLKNAKREKNSIKAFFELHIEQGPILEDCKKDIGLVETIVGLNSYEIEFTGISGHSGTTPMNLRKDALVAASKFVLDLNSIAKGVAHGSVATVGELNVFPNALNVIPGHVFLSVDLRATKKELISSMYDKMINSLKDIEKTYGISFEIRETLYIAPVNMNQNNLEILEELSSKLGYNSMRMNSGAGHDSMIMADLCPTNLIFVPSINGISHHPEEWTDPKDFEKGIKLLLNVILNMI